MNENTNKDNYSFNTICDVIAFLIRRELQKDNPDENKIEEFTYDIQKFCGGKPYERGEVPEHLEEYLYEEEQ